MSKWEQVEEKVLEKSLQYLDQGNAKSKVKHTLRMQELYEELAEVDISKVTEGKQKYKQLEALLEDF